MANTKNSRSNKTAHVLNLLTEPGEASQEPARTPAAAPAPAPTPDNSEEVASAIRDALEEDLLSELSEEAPVPAEPPVAAESPEPEPAPAEEEPVPEPEPEPAKEEPLPEPEPEPEPEPVKAAEPIPEPEPQPQEPPQKANPMEDITYINVLQALVEDKVDKYMKQFKMCACRRCRTDVVALALTTLPAKYIVVPEHESVPMLSIYESRYGAAVTAQLIAACQKVSANPRHSGESDGRLRLGAPRRED